VRASVYAAIPRSCSFCSLRIQALSREESIYEEHFVEVEMEVEVEVEVFMRSFRVLIFNFKLRASGGRGRGGAPPPLFVISLEDG
jgi:hypothetical protein